MTTNSINSDLKSILFNKVDISVIIEDVKSLSSRNKSLDVVLEMANYILSDKEETIKSSKEAMVVLCTLSSRLTKNKYSNNELCHRAIRTLIAYGSLPSSRIKDRDIMNKV